MKIIIENLTNGKYGIRKENPYLYFEDDSTNNECLFLVDKRSALEIAHTLIDSVDLLDKNAEELLLKIDERINN